MNDALTAVGQQTTQRYRLPGIEREGIAQLSLLETALWPLQGGKLYGSVHETEYSFQVGAKKQTAAVRVYAPLGLQTMDEYILWGLMGICLSRPEPEGTLLATPYWLIKKLGMAVGGFQYDQLRASLERLALVAYQNTGFYNPVTQQHERITVHFFSSYLPTKGRGGEVDAERAWRIEWDAHFFQMCQATGGTLLFDLDLYRVLSPAARRLFLKLKDRFWRTKRVFLNVDDLTINGLGYSADRPLKKRKFDLTQCMRELLERGVIELGQGQTDPKQLFLKRSKGCYVAVFYEGAYFRQAVSPRVLRQQTAITTDALYEPLWKIGVDAAGIARILKRHTRANIQRWVKITDAAVHEKPRGFGGFKVSPAAFLVDALDNGRLPPDWIYAHEKRARQEQWERERVQAANHEQQLRGEYAAEQQAALQAFLRTPDIHRQWQAAHDTFLILYQRLEPERSQEAAREAATAKMERELFTFPEFGVWVLDRLPPGK